MGEMIFLPQSEDETPPRMDTDARLAAIEQLSALLHNTAVAEPVPDIDQLPPHRRSILDEIHQDFPRS